MLILGIIVAAIIDLLWWQIDYKKAEKGLEFHEHYHIALEMSIAAVFAPDIISDFLHGMAIVFALGEWTQTYKEGESGHPFAIQSGHFKESTIFALILVGVLVFLNVYIPS